MRRPVLVLVCCILASIAAGCGDSPGRPPPALRLTVDAPADGSVVSGRVVEIRGRVRPAAGARVVVLGRRAEVRDGTFRASVELQPGANIIDVAASAAGRRPAVAALRLVREMPVIVPDVEGRDPESAVEQLEALGLRTEVEERTSALDRIFPGDLGVCSTDPGAGEPVRQGTRVRITVARLC